jgi:replicative DNA helicase
VKNKLQVNAEYFENVIACQSLTNAYYTSLVYDHLKPENFKSAGNKLIVGIIKDFYSKRKTLPTITEIKTYIKKEEEAKLIKDTLISYKQIDLQGNFDELVQNTEAYFKEKNVYNAVLKIVDDVTNDKADYGKFLQMFEKACNVTLINDIGLDFYGQYQKIIDELGTPNETIPTGWNFIDDKIGGGLAKKGRALYLFLGPTNVGKSIFLGNVASNMAERGLTTVLISLEMPEMMYAKRISSHLSKIPIKDIQQQIKPLETYFQEVSEQRKQKLIIKEFPPKSITIGGIRAYLESLVKSGIKPDILVIDYLGLIKASSGDNSYEQGKSTAEDLRALSYFFSIPIVSAIQTNRCLDINTEVIKNDNSICKIKDLKIGDSIKSNNGNVIVRYVYPIEKQKTYKIRLKSGKEIICSSKHIFPTSGGPVSIGNNTLKINTKLQSLFGMNSIIDDEVVSIEECGERETIDINVSGNNLFFANSILTHNSGMEKPSLDTVSESLGVAFTADVVWSIHQDEGDQELGIIKVGGIKNRVGPKHGATAMRIDYNTLSLSEERDYIGLANNNSDEDEMLSMERRLEKASKQVK